MLLFTNFTMSMIFLGNTTEEGAERIGELEEKERRCEMLTSMRHSCCTHQLVVPVANCPRHAQSHTSQHPNIEGGGTPKVPPLAKNC